MELKLDATQSSLYVNESSSTSFLRNASFIGNYGADLQSFNSSVNQLLFHSVNNVLHIPRKDIVLPQPLHNAARRRFNQCLLDSTLCLHRGNDSYFHGTIYKHIPGRDALNTMSASMITDYHSKGTESFVFNSTTRTSDAYFGYHPCGAFFACWSRRLYDMMASHTIPVIIGSGQFQAFERLIDWRQISIKATDETWSDEIKRTKIRQMMRREAEEERARSP